MKNRLRDLRTAQSISQGELADRMDVSRQTINAIEADKYDPSLPLAYKLAAHFDVPVETLFFNPFRKSAIEPAVKSPRKGQSIKGAALAFGLGFAEAFEPAKRAATEEIQKKKETGDESRHSELDD
ncbi:MAG: helix-turn-helix transcriptional regulator [Sphingomicrobium sp.]